MTTTPDGHASRAFGLFGGGMGILWLLFWTLITGAFDVLWLWMVASQMATWSYAHTDGKVLESRVELGRDSDGDATYDAKVSYEYFVQGQVHRGETIRNFSFRMNGGRQDAERAVQRYPAGKAITVHFHPDRPGTAVLESGFRGSDFFLPLFMMPFNIVMLGGWLTTIAAWRPRARPAGIRVRDDGLKVTARIFNVTPLTAVAGALMISSFVLIFVCGFGMMILPMDWLVAVAWCVVLGSAAFAWWLCRQPATTLEYDHFSGRVSIAKSDGQTHSFLASEVVTVGLDDTDEDPECLDEDDVADAGIGGSTPPAESDSDSLPSYSPVITYRDATGKEQTVTLADWSSAESVTWMVKWLQETLRLKG